MRNNVADLCGKLKTYADSRHSEVFRTQEPYLNLHPSQLCFHKIYAHCDEDSLYFWRTKSGKEVDFVLKKSKDLIAVEVKINDRIDKQDLNGLLAFAEDTGCKRLFLVSNEPRPRNFTRSGLPAKTSIQILPNVGNQGGGEGFPTLVDATENLTGFLTPKCLWLSSLEENDMVQKVIFSKLALPAFDGQ